MFNGGFVVLPYSAPEAIWAYIPVAILQVQHARQDELARFSPKVDVLLGKTRKMRLTRNLAILAHVKHV